MTISVCLLPTSMHSAEGAAITYDAWCRFLARDSIIMLSALYAIARPSVCLSVRRVDYTKTLEVRIMKFPTYGSHIPVVFTGSRNSKGFPPSRSVKQGRDE